MGVYRLHQSGDNTILGWEGSKTTPYNNQTISTITDPNGGNPAKEITSIPSPFARIDLVKSAFAEVNQACNGKNGQALLDALDGDDIYHKMVSYSLDVGEIFFNLDNLIGKVEVIVWNQQSLGTLINNGGLIGGKCYANALQTYWQAGGTTYNFNLVQNIYILNFRGGPNPLNVIGATSPSTLFFSTANDLSYVTGIQFGQHVPFNKNYQPLYKRDAVYIEMLWWMKSSIENFPSLFPEINAYLNYTFAAIQDQEVKSKLQQIGSAANVPSGLTTISIRTGNVANDVEILGNKLYQQQQKPVENSDFRIKSTKQPSCNYLVLPVGGGNTYAGWLYTTAAWGNGNSAPISDSIPIAQRRLPYVNTQQPYLTISDFLEETILATEARLNNGIFFDGYLDDDAISYLLPLKPLFFEFFSAGDLIENRMIELERIAGGNVNVILNIPTTKGIIIYSRMYQSAPADLPNNIGHIVSSEELLDCDVSIMPAISTPQNADPYYTFAAIRPFGKKLALTFYNDGKRLNMDTAPQERNENITNSYKNTVYTLKNRFECIQVITSSGTSMAVPNLQEIPGNDAFSFAVDLGTSNTHIEYTVNGNTRQCIPFEYTSDSKMVGLLFLSRTRKISDEKTIEVGLEQARDILSRDILPETLDANEAYHFPTRTALSFMKGINWDIQTNPLELTNVCFPYGKQPFLPYDDYATNIKWGDEPVAQNQIAYYIKNILLLIRNKVLTSGGDLSKTSLVWFYPTSMSTYRRNLFQDRWNEEFSSLFGNNTQISSMSESQAPVLYHKQNNSSAKNMLTIDIGGGTTDMAFASLDEVKYVTSFRFAANALFEDSFSTTNAANGIIDFYKPIYFRLAENNESIAELRSILSSFDANPTNLANALFTLKDVPCVRKSVLDNSIDFISKLRNDKYFKMEFVVFYAAILYHACKIIKATRLPLPRHIALSGNGSNLLKVLATPNNSGKQQLADFSKRIVEASTGSKYEDGNKLDILGFTTFESPKCSTCKGGLLQQVQGISNAAPETVILQSASNTILNKDLDYKNIDDGYVKKVMQETYAFFEMLRGVDEQYKFKDNFGISGNA